MHMADALISPAVGGTMWLVTAGVTAYCARQVRTDAGSDSRRVPLMGVLGAFIFAAQMVNFSIPGTGSSGHLAGGMILAILLGPHAAFLTLASVITVQALLFADGGLLALGCNVFNMAFFACFVAYPLLYRPIVGGKPGPRRLLIGSSLAAIVALQLGAFSVVLETLFSGITALPFGTFVLLMQPIHLAIGVVEGLVTAAVVTFVWKARPEVLELAAGLRSTGVSPAFGTGILPVNRDAGILPASVGTSSQPARTASLKPVLLALSGVTILTAALLSWFASTHPDGLEWSLARTTGKTELDAPPDTAHATLARVQEQTSLLPDYDFRKAEETSPVAATDAAPGPPVGTSVAGLAGSAATLAVIVLVGLVLKRRSTPDA